MANYVCALCLTNYSNWYHDSHHAAAQFYTCVVFTFETKTNAMMKDVPMKSPTVKTEENLFFNLLSVYVDNRVIASTILVM